MSYNTQKQMTKLNVGKLLDELTFPALACSVLVGASFAASQVIYSNRSFLNDLADQLETAQHPERVLWLTDSFTDRNGVSSFLKTALKTIQKNDYPIDILTCHPTLPSEEHLIVLNPVSECKVKRFEDQTFHIPDILTLQRVFEQGGYDRIICSTEFLMGAYALFLSKAFTIPAFFYMHTDWMEFIDKTTQLNQHETDRIRRLLRAYYQQFEGVFTLNNDHRDWLISQDMGLDPKKVFMTSHWVEPSVAEIHLSKAQDQRPLKLLYAGRISEEKGVFDLPEIMERIWAHHPDAELTIAGSGPSRESLSMLIPKAKFTGWLETDALNERYQTSDLLLLPSRFDTFGCVVLEALNHGLPVVAFNEKGPKEIITHEESGYLVEDPAEMAQRVIEHMQQPDKHYAMKLSALKRAMEFSAEPIIEKLLAHTGINAE